MRWWAYSYIYSFSHVTSYFWFFLHMLPPPLNNFPYIFISCVCDTDSGFLCLFTVNLSSSYIFFPIFLSHSELFRAERGDKRSIFFFRLLPLLHKVAKQKSKKDKKGLETFLLQQYLPDFEWTEQHNISHGSSKILHPARRWTAFFFLFFFGKLPE